MNNKKGQAAMEFLMTYGWAILAAVIVVGVLWYLIGNPSNLAGDRFALSAPLVANAMNLQNGQVEIEFRNGEATQITVSDIELSDTTGPCTDATGWTVSAGELVSMTINCADIASGDRFNSDVVITYTKPGSSVSLRSTGTITGSVP